MPGLVPKMRMEMLDPAAAEQACDGTGLCKIDDVTQEPTVGSMPQPDGESGCAQPGDGAPQREQHHVPKEREHASIQDSERLFELLAVLLRG